MRVNPQVFTKRMDMLGDIQIPNCPSEFRKVAQNIVNMFIKPDFALGKYNTMTQADKKIMVAYWQEYDSLILDKELYTNFKYWFIEKATAPELLTRSRRWLCEHNYLFPDISVSERALKASENYRGSFKG